MSKVLARVKRAKKQKIINLTDASKSTANPQLIIKEHDVLASHSAAVGVIDSEQLYYLMSRGLTKRQATELIIMSNIEDVIKFVSDKKLLNEILKNN